MVIVDTSVWIAFFNRQLSREKVEVDRLLDREEVLMVGIVLTELVQGTRSVKERGLITDGLLALPYLEMTQSTWLLTGDIAFGLLRKGITVATPDLIIAALSLDHACHVYSLDTDFQKIPALPVHTPTT